MDHFFKYLSFCLLSISLWASCTSERVNDQAIYTSTKDSVERNSAEDTTPGQPVSEDVPRFRDEQDQTEVLLYKGKAYVFTSMEEALAEPERVVYLDLEGKNLNRLPTELSKLTNLEALYLADNNLTTLPDSLNRQLPRLRILDLSNNAFQTIPSNLPALEYLNLSANRISSLPEDLKQLNTLKIVNLARNNLSAIPPSLYQLDKLEYLFLEGIPLDTLGNEILQLSQLKRVSLENCRLQRFPASLLQMPGLEYINLSRNAIKEIPKDISRLKKLFYLNVSYNAIAGSLEALYTSDQLIQLDLSHNPLPDIPSRLFSEIPLKALDISHTQIREISPGIGRAQGLVWFAAKGTGIYDLPPSISECQRLHTLRLGSNPNLKLPETLSELSNLPRLNFLELSALKPTNTSLDFPEQITALKRLITLDIRSNKLENPALVLNRLASLPDLKALNLSNCGIREALPAFEQLESLRLLGLDIQNMNRGEVEKLPRLLPSQVRIVDGSIFFEYFQAER